MPENKSQDEVKLLPPSTEAAKLLEATRQLAKKCHEALRKMALDLEHVMPGSTRTGRWSNI